MAAAGAVTAAVAVAGLLADLFGGGDPAWAPSDKDLQMWTWNYWQDIMKRQGAAENTATNLWDSLGGFIPTDAPLDNVLEQILTTSASRDILPLLGMGSTASANRAQGWGAPPSQGISQFGTALANLIGGATSNEPTDTSSFYEDWMNINRGGGSPPGPRGW